MPAALPPEPERAPERQVPEASRQLARAAAPPEAAPERRRIGLELIDKGIAREGCPVLDVHGNVVGETTSGGPAPTIGKNMAMAIVRVDAAKEEDFFVEVRGRGLRARRVKLPFYRSANK